MKKQSRKLNLNRETILPLTSDELGIINGGFTPLTSQLTTSIPSRFSCPSVPSLPSRLGCDSLPPSAVNNAK